VRRSLANQLKPWEEDGSPDDGELDEEGDMLRSPDIVISYSYLHIPIWVYNCRSRRGGKWVLNNLGGRTDVQLFQNECSNVPGENERTYDNEEDTESSELGVIWRIAVLL